MKTNLIRQVCALLFAAMLSASVASGEVKARSIDIDIDIDGARSVELIIPAGKVAVRGTASGNMKASAAITCEKADNDHCDEALMEQLTWQSFGEDNKTGLALLPADANMYNGFHPEISVQIPEGYELLIKQKYGELDVRGLTSCIKTEVKAGLVIIHFPQKRLASVDLHAKVGDVRLVTPQQALFGERVNLVGARLQWQQQGGECDLKAGIEMGNIEVVLE